MGAAVLAVLASAPAALAARPLGAEWLRGMSVPAWNAESYGGPAMTAALDEIGAVGANAVAITPTWFQSTASGLPAGDSSRTPTMEALEGAVRDARGRGLDVIVKPHVDVDDGTYRGELAPSDRDAWWDAYRTIVLKTARAAARGEAGWVVVGTELTSMTTASDESRWRGLIAEVRRAFGGKVTYAANFTPGPASVGFWDALDVIGVDGYYRLAKSGSSADVPRIVRAWLRLGIADGLRALHERYGKRVVFLELGYQSLSGALASPGWATGGDDPDMQRRAYEAALEFWSRRPWFGGIVWWAWPAPPGDDPSRFSPRGKPAGDVLGAWWREPGAAPAPDTQAPRLNWASREDWCAVDVAESDQVAWVAFSLDGTVLRTAVAPPWRCDLPAWEPGRTGTLSVASYDWSGNLRVRERALPPPPDEVLEPRHRRSRRPRRHPRRRRSSRRRRRSRPRRRAPPGCAGAAGRDARCGRSRRPASTASASSPAAAGSPPTGAPPTGAVGGPRGAAAAPTCAQCSPTRPARSCGRPPDPRALSELDDRPADSSKWEVVLPTFDCGG